VALDPAFATNQILYFTFSEPREIGNGESLARARLVESATGAHLEDVRVIFRQQPGFKSDRQFGSRIVFGADGSLFVTLGERGESGAVGQAQDLMSHLGKVVRLNADGSVPADNPFVARKDARPEIWSSGHRNIQAAAFDAVTGRLWTVEHGPRGGDELNLTLPGRNYGWPVISYGIDYNGEKIGSGITARQGMEQPTYYWDPEIMPSGMVVYRGALFPEWQGSLFIGGLASLKLVRLELDGERVVGEEWLLQDRFRRVRDVQQGPDGALYVLTEFGEQSELLRLRPAQ
jgi:aldose sugar dehydrogenase